jgi:hypothetical protein
MGCIDKSCWVVRVSVVIQEWQNLALDQVVTPYLGWGEQETNRTKSLLIFVAFHFPVQTITMPCCSVGACCANFS